MAKHLRTPLATALALIALVFSFGGTTSIAAAHSTATRTTATVTMGAKRSATASVTPHVVDMSKVPAETPGSLVTKPRQLPLLTGVSPVVYAQRKAAAATNASAPSDASDSVETMSPTTPTTSAKFKGMADSATICAPFGCQPPDQALAASPSWVFQGVNSSFAVYSTTGKLQSGWPKAAQSFFNIPNSCAGLAFVSDPRAFYDPADQRFWAAMLEVEGAFGVNNCAEVTRYWIAVSQTSNPNGAWNVYHFDMSAGTTNAADYTQFGFDQQAMYFSGNMFNQAGSAYEYAEFYAVTKSTMESGQSATGYGFLQLTANGVLVDTVQPVENESSTFPGAGLLINSFDINGNGSADCASIACKGLVVWADANPGTASDALTGKVVSSKAYILPPNADQPGCSQCVDTNDTRIAGTPVYQNGYISFALNTGAKNSTQVVPAVYWGQVKPTISSGTITGLSLYQSGYIKFSGDRDASFGALMADGSGKLLMVFDTMSSTIYPSIMYTTRLTTDKLGAFESKVYLTKGTAATTDQRWGDYEAASYDGTSSNHIWFSAQYSNGDWATEIGAVAY